MKLKSVLSIAVALIVAVVIVPFVWKIVQEKNNDRLISNWKVRDVHTTSIYTTRGSGGMVRLEWQKDTLSAYRGLTAAFPVWDDG